jgi:hypothetical protein
LVRRPSAPSLPPRPSSLGRTMEAPFPRGLFDAAQHPTRSPRATKS